MLIFTLVLVVVLSSRIFTLVLLVVLSSRIFTLVIVVVLSSRIVTLVSVVVVVQTALLYSKRNCTIKRTMSVTVVRSTFT